jgi:hypothetical protein
MLGDEETTSRAASVRLPLAQLTAKVGAGFRQYPREGGVLVPRALAPLAPDLAAQLPAAALPPAQDARLRLGRAVVAEVARVLRRLPAEVLALPLPPPSHVAGRTGIEHRTRNTVERLVPFETARPWSVGRYLAVPGFGPRCLVDVLAAHEESARLGAAPGGAAGGPPPAPDAPSEAALVAIARRLRGLLPLTGAELAALFPDEPFARALDPLRTAARAFDDAGIGAPFQLVRRDGRSLAVAPGSAGITRAACEEAARQVAAWGLTEVEQVAARVQCLSESVVRETIVRRVLVALPRLRWLDGRMQWFSFAGERSPLGKAVARTFAATDAVRLDGLLAALAARPGSARRAPETVLLRYLDEIAGCEILDGEVRRRATSAASARAWRGTG